MSRNPSGYCFNTFQHVLVLLTSREQHFPQQVMFVHPEIVTSTSKPPSSKKSYQVYSRFLGFIMY